MEGNLKKNIYNTSIFTSTQQNVWKKLSGRFGALFDVLLPRLCLYSYVWENLIFYILRLPKIGNTHDSIACCKAKSHALGRAVKPPSKELLLILVSLEVQIKPALNQHTELQYNGHWSFFCGPSLFITGETTSTVTYNWEKKWGA